jgi:hypothetical protein
MSKLKLTEVKVREILMDNPEARDNDNLLLSEYLKRLEYGDFTFIANEIVSKKIATMFKTVERTRRKVQEKNPELRGENWLKRHLAQDDFIQYALDIENTNDLQTM